MTKKTLAHIVGLRPLPVPALHVFMPGVCFCMPTTPMSPLYSLQYKVTVVGVADGRRFPASNSLGFTTPAAG